MALVRALAVTAAVLLTMWLALSAEAHTWHPARRTRAPGARHSRPRAAHSAATRADRHVVTNRDIGPSKINGLRGNMSNMG